MSETLPFSYEIRFDSFGLRHDDRFVAGSL
jgi:hypothetical protein